MDQKAKQPSGAEKVLEDLRKKLEEKKKEEKAKTNASPKAKAKCKAKAKSSKRMKKEEKSVAPVLKVAEAENVNAKKGSKKQPDTVQQKTQGKKEQGKLSASELESLDIQDVQTPWPSFSCKRKLLEQFPEDTLHRFKSRCYHRTLDYFKRQGVDDAKAKLFAGAAHEKGRKQWAVLFPEKEE